jgi:hypothetical protein
MKSLKKLLFITILLFISPELFAQERINKGDIIIHITGSSSVANQKFLVDIYKRDNSVKIVYAYFDKLIYAEAKEDPEYQRAKSNLDKYKADDPKRDLIWDTIGIIFERHSIYTRDSVTVNVKTDTAYINLLQRVANTNKTELTPHIDKLVLDGDVISISVNTFNKSLKTNAYAPDVKTHPLLINLITTTLNKGKSSSAVQKIRKFFGEF